MKKNPMIPDYEELLRTLVLTRVRIVGIIGAVLILFFSGLDAVVYPEHWFDFLLLRTGLSLAFLLLVAFSFHPAGRPQGFLLSDLLVFTAGAGISLMIYWSEGSASRYYEGLNLTFLGLFAMNSFKPKHHVLTGCSVLGCYVLAAIAGPGPFQPAHFASGLFFMGSTLLFVTLAAKFYGRQHFDQYLKNEEIKAKNREIDEAYQKLRETEKLKDEFFANVSHELRTPLTLILAPLESLLAGPADGLDSSTRETLATMHRNTARLLQMVNGLLDFAKLEAGKMQVRREPLEAVSAAETILEDFKPAARKKGLRLSFHPSVPEAWILMDPHFYDCILFNLISNAVKFTEKGQIAVFLDVRASRLTLTVQDTGIGIPQDQIGRLFEKFRQVESTSVRRFEGTGLGLALVKEFVTLLRGNISVSGREGEGTLFTVTCDAPPAEPQEAGAAAGRRTGYCRPSLTPAEFPGERLGAGKSKILIAEDNRELASYIGSLLEPLAQIRFTEDGKKALEIAREWVPDILLSDVMMPGMDGYALCREIKKDAAICHIPVVLLTALTHREAFLKGWEAGADEYLFKPFHPAELVARIRSLLNSLALRQEIESRLLRQTEESTRLRTELEQIELFSFVASHDLQEPLHKLLILCSVLRHSQNQWTSEQLNYFQNIDESVRRMQQYLKDVLEYAHAGTDDAETSGQVDLNEAVRSVQDELGEQIKEAGVRIEKDTLPLLRGDPFHMKQLFKNILANAVKFRRPEGTPEIKIRYEERPDMHVIIFEDNGIGFDFKYAEDLFKPFFRLEKQKIKGSGIGLAVCRKIVRQYGGRIVARGEPGKGAAFEVFFPKTMTAPSKMKV